MRLRKDSASRERPKRTLKDEESTCLSMSLPASCVLAN